MSSIAPVEPPAAASPDRARTMLVAGGVLVALVAAGLAVTVGQEPRPAPTFVNLPDVPAVPLLPSEAPSPGVTRPLPVATTPVRDQAGQPGGGGPPAAPAKPSATSARPRPSKSTAAPPVLAVGTAVGLEPVGEAGRRVRHRNYWVRVDAIGPGSSAVDKADAKFLVRPGRADPTCASFEASNFPGYFLRDAGFAMRLDRADGGGRFDAEATFCAVPVPAGGFVLRGKAPSDRYVTQSNGALSLKRVRPDQAQVFVTRSPL